MSPRGASAAGPAPVPPRDLLDQLTLATFAALFLLVLAGPLMSGGAEAFSGDGNPIRQVSYLLVFAVLLVTTARANALDRALATSLPVNFLLLYCWASLAWAIAPGIGTRRIALTSVIVYSVFLAVAALGPARTLRAMRLTLAGLLALNFATVALLPGIGIHQFEPGGDPGLIGDWRGVFPEKNLTGSICAVTFLVFALDPTPMSRRTRLAVALGALFFLARTGSKTSMGIGAIACAAGLAFRRYDRRTWPHAMTALALGALAAALAVYASWDRIEALFQRQDAFTGRTQIWSVIFAYLNDGWLTGAGYGSFWNIGPDSPVYRYARSGSWLNTVASSHNGYLDVAVQIGVPGLLVALFALYLHPLARLLTEPARARGGLLPALLLFCAGHNLTEATMLDRDQFMQFVLIWTIAAIRSPAPARDPEGVA